MQTSDVDVIDVASLDEEHQQLFDKPWLCQHEDGTIVQFDTEHDACNYAVRVSDGTKE